MVKRFFVAGRVQGVGFRWFVRDAAEQLGIQGFVRNLADGRVEVLAEGAADRLEALARALRRGPAGARVEAVEEREEPAPTGARGFRIRAGGGEDW
ncbi:MAG: acylphosphatase [Acidobacteria bacterium]|nr:acylphosphatase [Acidobacteriota bacterium]